MTDTIRLSDSEVFRPRYDDLSKDLERLSEWVVELYHRDRLGLRLGAGLKARFIEPASKEIMDAYFERGLYAQIEAYWTHDDFAFGWPAEEEIETMDRLIAHGQGLRAIRLWRSHLSGVKRPYWDLIATRTRGFKVEAHRAGGEKTQRAAFNNWMARIPDYKREILAMMDAAEATFRRAGATESQLARLAQDRAEVEAEQRRRATGKPDPRKMDRALFWEIIGTPADGSTAERLDALPDRLAAFKPGTISAFAAELHACDVEAYRSDIWALAYLLQDGCSDDDFEAFRCWLILQGEARFNATLAAPDQFDVTDFPGRPAGSVDLHGVASLAYDMRAGKPMRRRKRRLPALAGPDLSEDDFATALPMVAAKLAG